MGRATGNRRAVSSSGSFDVFGARRGTIHAQRDSYDRDALIARFEQTGMFDDGIFERLHAAGLTAVGAQFERLTKLISSEVFSNEDAFMDAAQEATRLARQGRLVEVGEPLLQGLSVCFQVRERITYAEADEILSLLSSDTPHQADSERLKVFASSLADRLPVIYNSTIAELRGTDSEDMAESMLTRLEELDDFTEKLLYRAAANDPTVVAQLAPLLESAGELLNARLLPQVLCEHADVLSRDPLVRRAAPGFVAAQQSSQGAPPRPDTETMYAIAGFEH